MSAYLCDRCGLRLKPAPLGGTTVPGLCRLCTATPVATTVYVAAPIDHAAIDAAWTETIARWPYPATSHARHLWMAKHRTHLNAAYRRHHAGAQPGQLDLFTVITEAA